jgi:hypothetical protein
VTAATLPLVVVVGLVLCRWSRSVDPSLRDPPALPSTEASQPPFPPLLRYSLMLA